MKEVDKRIIQRDVMMEAEVRGQSDVVSHDAKFWNWMSERH